MYMYLFRTSTSATYSFSLCFYLLVLLRFPPCTVMTCSHVFCDHESYLHALQTCTMHKFVCAAKGVIWRDVRHDTKIRAFIHSFIHSFHSTTVNIMTFHQNQCWILERTNLIPSHPCKYTAHTHLDNFTHCMLKAFLSEQTWSSIAVRPHWK